jgi:chorismate mutase
MKRLNRKQTTPKIDKLRKKIDLTDKQILKFFKNRLTLATEIAEEKKRLNLPLYQRGRWKTVLRDRRRMAKKLGLDRIFIQRFMNLIHEESLRLQARVKNSTKSTRTNK